MKNYCRVNVFTIWRESGKTGTKTAGGVDIMMNTSGDDQFMGGLKASPNEKEHDGYTMQYQSFSQ